MNSFLCTALCLILTVNCGFEIYTHLTLYLSFSYFMLWIRITITWPAPTTFEHFCLITRSAVAHCPANFSSLKDLLQSLGIFGLLLYNKNGLITRLLYLVCSLVSLPVLSFSQVVWVLPGRHWARGSSESFLLLSLAHSVARSKFMGCRHASSSRHCTPSLSNCSPQLSVFNEQVY